MKHIITFLAIACTTVAVSQIKLQGVVKDSIGAPLELANVIAINSTTKALESYGITDTSGKYTLALSKNGTYTIKVSYIGLKSLEVALNTTTENLTKNFTLLADNSLDEVQLTYEMPVTIKGDTLIYNADSFKNGTERKLEDVLEKLPGVEINEDGQIEVEGKTVNKVMVEGKEFFDGDTKVATKNIPSNAVDKIQVLRNYSEVGQLSGVTNNQDNVAINIKLKKGKDSFWFGDVTAGTGATEGRTLYLAQPKLFYYSPKLSVNFIGDINDIGEVNLSNRDIRGLGGGFRAPSRNSGTNINLGNNSLGGLTNLGDAIELQTKLAATNFSYSPNKRLDLSGFLIYNSTRIRSQETQFIDYIQLADDPNTPFDESTSLPPDEFTEQNGREATNQALAKLSASFKPNVSNQLDYDIFARISEEEEKQTEISSILGATSQLENVKPYSINQSLNYYYTLNENNIFAFEAQHLLKDEDPFYKALLANNPLNNNDPDIDNRDPFDGTANNLGFNLNQNNYNLNQNRRIKSNQLDAKLDYYHILNAKSNLNFTLGTILSRQDFNSDIFQFLDDGTTFNSTPTSGISDINDTQYNFSDVYLATRYRVKLGKFTLTPGLSFHSYGNTNTQFGSRFTDNFFRVLPEFESRIQFKKSEQLTFRYNMQNNFTDVTSIAEGIVANNFNNFQTGNAELQNALSHNLSLFYSSFNLFNYTNVFAGANYSKNIDQIRNLTSFESVIRTNSFFNSPFDDETLSVFGRVQRTFGKIRAGIRTNLTYSLRNQFVQGAQTEVESFSQFYRPEIRTNFREAPNVTLRYAYSVTNNNQGANDTRFVTNAPSASFDAYIWDAVTFRTDYTYNNQQDNLGNSDSFQTWDASLAYRKNRDAKWEFELEATNLLDIESKISNNAGNISVFSSETFIQPRFVILKIIYSL